jgi:prolyl oligopeptidase
MASARSLFLMKIRFSLVIAAAVWIVAPLNLFGAEPLPQTPKKPVTDDYRGVKVEDNYQWLEQDDDPAVKAWSDAQSRQTREYLDKLPDRTAIEKQLTDWYAKTSPTYSGIVSRPGILFARKFQPPKQQQMLVTLASAEDLKSEKIVLDPNKLDPSG